MSDKVKIQLEITSCVQCPYSEIIGGGQSHCTLLNEFLIQDEVLPNCPLRVDRVTDGDDELENDWSCNAHGESTA